MAQCKSLKSLTPGFEELPQSYATLQPIRDQIAALIHPSPISMIQTRPSRLAPEEQVLALEESAGAWTEESHPEMQDGAAIDRWLTRLRQSWTTPKGAADDSLPA
jgi:hypothetical protein